MRASETAAKWVKAGAGTHSPEQEKEKDRERAHVSIPYSHKLTHGMKNVAARYGVRAVFKAPKKLRGICSAIKKKTEYKGAMRNEGCGIKHRAQHVRCATRVVYDIGL